MDKDSSLEPNTKEKTKPATKKKRTTPKKATAKSAGSNKKPSRIPKSASKTGSASKPVSRPKKKPARKTPSPAKVGRPPKAVKSKQKPKSKIQKDTKAPRPSDLPSPEKDTGDTLKTPIAQLSPEMPRPKQPDIPAQQKTSEKIYPPTDAYRGPESYKWFVRSVFICFVILIAIMIFISYQNTNRYFISSRDGAVEIWKGKFSPKSRKRILIMPGIQPPEQIKKVYTKEEVFPIAFSFYIGKADALMEVPGLPDFVGIKSYLNRALSYATTDALRNTALARINSIDLMILLYKADVAASRGTLAGLETAVKYLDQAATLDPDEIEAKLIEQKLASIQQLRELLSPKPQKTKSVKDKSEKSALKKESTE